MWQSFYSTARYSISVKLLQVCLSTAPVLCLPVSPCCYADGGSSFDMQMILSEEPRSVSVALRLLHFRGSGMSCCGGSPDAAEKCYQGMQWQGLQTSMNGLCPASSAVLLNWDIRARDWGSVLTPLDWNPSTDIELHKQFFYYWHHRHRRN